MAQQKQSIASFARHLRLERYEHVFGSSVVVKPALVLGLEEMNGSKTIERCVTSPTSFS